MNIKFLTQKITIQKKFSGSCANKHFRYLFETLPVATFFGSDRMGFLGEVNFLKGYQIELMSSKTEKSWKLAPMLAQFCRS